MLPTLPDTEARVLRYIADPGADDFLDVLNAVVTYQRAWNPALASYWASQGFEGAATEVSDVPAVPTDVFKHVPLRTTELPTPIVFRTSGTTVGDRGAHWHHSIAAYHAGAAAFFKAAVIPDRDRIPFIPLVLDPAEVPDSSLSHMVGLLAERFAPTPPTYLLRPDGLDVSACVAALEAAREPVLLIGTAFAFVHLFDQWTGSVVLPEGSRVIETGGFKGKSREVERAELYRWFKTRLGVADGLAISEYSMTELSSQLYTGRLRQALVDPNGPSALIAPHWIDVRAVDPATLRPLPPGETGLIRIVDLANVDSVVAIQTSDLGWIDEDGLHLLGRADGATLRGCSLTVEEITARQA